MKKDRAGGRGSRNNSSTVGVEGKLWLLADRLRNTMDAAARKHLRLGSVAPVHAVAVCGLLLLAVGIIFGQTLGHDFVDLDDDEFVSNNPHVNGGLTIDSILWALRDGPFHECHPLATWSHMLDCQLYGLWPGGHHLSSVLLHAAASIALLVALARMTGDFWPSALVAVLFAVHPLHVESVAWIAERRDVSSALFFMLVLVAYAGYARRPSLARYLAVAALLALGLMAKSSLVPLPLILLLLDYWPLRRFGGAASSVGAPDERAAFTLPTTPASREREPLDHSSAIARLTPGTRRALGLVLEKLPLVVLAAGASAIELSMHGKGYYPLTLGQKTANALVSCVAYLGQFVYPARLAAFYPPPGASLPLWKPAAALVLLLAITGAALVWRRRCPYLLVGWFWYLLLLAPVLGFVQVGTHARADRYTYLSQIGLCVALAWGAADWAKSRAPARRPAMHWALGGTALWITILSICAWRQTTYWRDSELLWRHAVAAVPSAKGHLNLGAAFERKGSLAEASQQYHAALALALDPAVGPISDPVRAEVYTRLGDLHAKQQRLDEAIGDYRRALAITPESYMIHNNLGEALAQQGKLDEAVAEYRQAIKDAPQVAACVVNLGIVFWQQGKLAEAIACYEQALALDPKVPLAHDALARILAEKERLGPAEVGYRRALALHPDSALTHFKLAEALAGQSKFSEAAASYEQALALDPHCADAHHNLADILARQGRFDEAIGHYRQAIEIKPDYALAHNNLGNALKARGRIAEAVEHYRQALKIDPAYGAARRNLDRLETAPKKLP